MTQNTYEISFGSFETVDGKMKFRRTVVGQQQAKNGIQAIRDLLTVRFAHDADLQEAVKEGRSVGSNKRLVVAGLTFEAKKL